ncbi:MAG: aspartate carbamoyltransferase, partial [Planctomycetaceae bacterium]
RAKEIFRISPGILKAMKKDTYLLHPFPRDYELSSEVDSDPRAVYFDMIQYGQFLRMGLLCLVLQAQLA